MDFRQLLLVGLLLGAINTAARAEIIYVDAANTGPPGTGAGEIWESAFGDLQDALDVAVTGDEIRVAAGMYRPVVPDDPDNVSETERGTSFEMKDGVEILGGFPPGGGTLDERDGETHITVLSGDIDLNDTVDDDGLVTDPDDIAGDNSFHVVDASDADETAILDGLWITAGLADGSFPHNSGAGALADNAGCEFRHVVFIGNRADGEGGGLVTVSGALPVLSQVRFEANEADIGGGVSGGMEAENIVFRNNHARIGGGTYIARGASVVNARFQGNSSTSDGGAVYLGGFATIDWFNLEFSGNYAGSNGGALVIGLGDPTLTNATFSGNRSGENGGAIYHFQPVTAQASIRNSTIWNNQANGSTSSPSASIYDDINDSAETTVSYSLVDNCNPDGNWNGDCGTDAGNNLADADPLFMDSPDPDSAPSVGGNLRLNAGSPAADAGNDEFLDDIEEDLDGNPRIQGEAVDLGPFESVWYTVHVTVEPVGSGLAVCDPNPAPPEEDSMCAQGPASGYRFTGWSGDCSGEACMLADVTDDQHVTAHFEVIETIFLDRFITPPPED